MFTDRVLQQGNGNLTLTNALLGYVMVHEITHVLEGIDRHSAGGRDESGVDGS